ncbi:acetylornithine transaminase [Streptomyces calidiresistens]|uniref:Acetylornithine aminotransferase n=1 Tax=Streptomyces calidiresistens TaxID=1485586 RepID=A0A7W3T6P3_9ACTN|nr:acetylornithine transaminase [Streptomyces calidiresistens]MBB0231955.1 acetylornithine transaminase [Streptomyces calidiresistens]
MNPGNAPDTPRDPGATGTGGGSGNARLIDRWRAVLTDNYGTPPLPLVSGTGARLRDADGREYLDFLGGIAVSSLGTGHPAVVRAVSEQVATLAHASNLYATEPPVALAERLLDLAGREGRVYFCNSGAEANEAAFKLARLTGRPRIVAAVGGFHGRTMGALALTGQPAKQEGFHPLPAGVEHVPYGDMEALRAAVTGETAMVILEPVQGENGVVVPPRGYLTAAREITRATGTLLAVDEVQTGIGRTGEWFACGAEGVAPDVITLAKGLGAGLPIGATLVFGPAADLFTPGRHGSTFGGNPVACAAALAVLDTIASTDLLQRVKEAGERLRAGIEALDHPLVEGVRGAGLLLGIVLRHPVAAKAQEHARGAGLLINAVAPDVIRLAPPLVVTDDEIDALTAALPGILDAAGAGIGKDEGVGG